MINDLLGEIRVRLYGIAKHSKGALSTNRYDTSDIVQQSLLQVWQEIAKVGVDEFTCNATYLKKIGRGKATQLRRHHTAQCRAANKDKPLDGDYADQSELDPQVITQQDELMTQAMMAASQLSRVRQAIIFRRFVDGKTFQQIADELDLTIDVTRNNYQKALQQLRNLLANRSSDSSSRV